MVREDFERRFSVRVVSRFEAKVCDAHFVEKDFHEADQVAQSDVVVGNYAFDLVEFGEMGGVDGFVTEDSIDGEQFGRFESTGLIGQLIKHGG